MAKGRECSSIFPENKRCRATASVSYK